VERDEKLRDESIRKGLDHCTNGLGSERGEAFIWLPKQGGDLGYIATPINCENLIKQYGQKYPPD